MIGKSTEAPSFYRSQGPSADGREGFESLSTTASPWGPDSQHGGPPAGLLARAIEGLSDAVIGRFTMELLGPVPVDDLAVSASILRPGRTVQLAAAELYDVARGRPVATARAWLFPASEAGPDQEPSAPAHGPEDGTPRERPTGWGGGYVDAVDWRWITGDLADPGPGVVWMRPPDLVEGERVSPVQRLVDLRRLRLRGECRLRPAGVGVPQHRADRPRPASARGRVGLPGRGDDPVQRRDGHGGLGGP